jgi:hypothetical protein
MGVRTNISNVKAVIPTELTDTEITNLIIQSNAIVTRQLSGEGLTTALLTDIETWMTAHLISIGMERQPKEEKVGDIWLKFKESPDGFMNLSTYGQMVLFLDTSGKFQNSAKQRISFSAVKQIQE